MSAESIAVVVVLAVCVAVVLVVVRSLAAEKQRLWDRYKHLKAVMAYEQWTREQRLARQQAQAAPADLLADATSPDSAGEGGPAAAPAGGEPPSAGGESPSAGGEAA